MKYYLISILLLIIVGLNATLSDDKMLTILLLLIIILCLGINDIVQEKRNRKGTIVRDPKTGRFKKC
jgi:hypothetical protein